MASPLAGPTTRTLPAATAATLPIHANERYSPASAVACASHSHANVTGSLSFIQVPKNLLSASGPQPTRPEVIHRSLRLQQSRISSSKTTVIPGSSEWTSDHAEPPRIATVSVRRHSALQDIKQSERPLIGRSAYDGRGIGAGGALRLCRWHGLPGRGRSSAGISATNASPTPIRLADSASTHNTKLATG